MASDANVADVHPHSDPSLIRGGPFYRLQYATHLMSADRWDLPLRIAVVVAVIWLPLILLTATLNPKGLPSLLLSYRVASRLLIAVPVLLLGQAILESRFKMLVAHFVHAKLLDPSEIPRFHEGIESVIRLRDSLAPELIILLLVIVHTVTAERSLVDATPWLLAGTGHTIQLTAAGWYAVVVSAPLFQLLLGIGLWKWLLWTVFAFRLSRLKLNLIPTHPDGRGGLGFLGLTPVAFTPIAFAATCVIGATWRHEILAGRATLMGYKFPALILLGLVAVVALGPLAFFVPRLARLRHHGILEYGILGQLHSADFHAKWIDSRVGHEQEFLTAAECSTLADFGQAYEKLKDLRPFPVDQEALIALGLSVVIPMLPVVLAAIPLMVVLKMLFEALK
ncbi:MAG TPA: hypothetical protein VMH20_20355 [Verrucomicrobiae bacterium]|nr:hypothetical protein [Verrucomicrobiae bacterium]